MHKKQDILIRDYCFVGHHFCADSGLILVLFLETVMNNQSHPRRSHNDLLLLLDKHTSPEIQ